LIIRSAVLGFVSEVGMSAKKRAIREQFRNATFGRDGHKCRICGRESGLDAHHITSRDEMPNGGYVVENGITLCDICHPKAEAFHATGRALPGFAPDDLYKLVGSSFEASVKADEEKTYP
jgi:hypothetical protein